VLETHLRPSDLNLDELKKFSPVDPSERTPLAVSLAVLYNALLLRNHRSSDIAFVVVELLSSIVAEILLALLMFA